MFTEGKQHLSDHTHQHHQADHCESDLLYKGALQDKSRIVCGDHPRRSGADKSDGYQAATTTSSSPTPPAPTRFPGLEILADDVRCTHGATPAR